MCNVRAFKMFCTASLAGLAHPRHRRNSPTISIQGGDYTKLCTAHSRDLSRGVISGLTIRQARRG